MGGVVGKASEDEGGVGELGAREGVLVDIIKPPYRVDLSDVERSLPPRDTCTGGVPWGGQEFHRWSGVTTGALACVVCVPVGVGVAVGAGGADACRWES